MVTQSSVATPARGSILPPAVVSGFAAAVGLWSLWFVTHLPWLGIPEQVSMPILLLFWLLASLYAARFMPGDRSRIVLGGLLAGLITAGLGLLILGSKLTEAPPHTFDDGVAEVSVKPAAGLITGGFLALGGVIGAIGAALGSFLPRSASQTPNWIGAFGVVTCVCAAPLLFIGGLVTSTNSGMAVPDWPGTFGANMFLYPLGPRADAGVFLEHTHRLFGALLGLHVLALMIWTLASKESRAAKGWAIACFVLVCFQGVLGGKRVLLGDPDIAEDNRLLAMFHGVSAQLVFACIVILAVVLSRAWKDSADLAPDGIPGGRRAKLFATAALHSTILQLILGAAYRHFRELHWMWAHAAWAMVVLILAVIASFALMSLPREAGRLSSLLRTAGQWLLGIVGVQFALGWVAFLLGGRAHEAETIFAALLRTAHQANGAALMAVIVLGAVFARRLVARPRVQLTPATA